MTGPEHYIEAEPLLATAYEDNLTTYEGENPAAARQIAEAQVHATLALAAATALDGEDEDAWRDAIGVPRSSSYVYTSGATS